MCEKDGVELHFTSETVTHWLCQDRIVVGVDSSPLNQSTASPTFSDTHQWNQSIPTRLCWSIIRCVDYETSLINLESDLKTSQRFNTMYVDSSLETSPFALGCNVRILPRACWGDPSSCVSLSIVLLASVAQPELELVLACIQPCLHRWAPLTVRYLM